MVELNEGNYTLGYRGVVADAIQGRRKYSQNGKEATSSKEGPWVESRHKAILAKVLKQDTIH